MDFNRLIPELSVSDYEKSLDFYVNLLGFSVAYVREEERFALISLQGAQLILVAVKPRRSGWGYKATTSAGSQCTSESSPTVLRRNWRQNSLGTRGRFARVFPGFPENPSGAICWRPL